MKLGAFAEFEEDVNFLCFLGKFGLKNQNDLDNEKFGTNQNYLCNVKFGTESNSNMLNLMVMFTFSLLDWKYPFWTDVVFKFKFVSLRLSLVHRLIQICGIR